jgi:hypothetical protein
MKDDLSGIGYLRETNSPHTKTFGIEVHGEAGGGFLFFELLDPKTFKRMTEQAYME